jgi:hypothetical protein
VRGVVTTDTRTAPTRAILNCAWNSGPSRGTISSGTKLRLTMSRQNSSRVAELSELGVVIEDMASPSPDFPNPERSEVPKSGPRSVSQALAPVAAGQLFPAVRL